MVFPVLYLTLLLSTYLMTTCHGNKLMDYNVDETLDRRLLQEERKGNLGNFQMQRRQSFVVTPPFEHNVITLDKSRAEREDSSWDDSVAQREINNKDGKMYDYEANGYENDDYDTEYNKNIDYKAPYNISDEYTAQNNVEILMDVLSKQNQMVEKLVELYQAEISNNQFDKLIESINKKQYMQFLEFNKGHIARNGTEANDTKTPPEHNKDEKEEKAEKEDQKETKDNEEKKNKDEKKQEEEKKPEKEKKPEEEEKPAEEKKPEEEKKPAEEKKPEKEKKPKKEKKPEEEKKPEQEKTTEEGKKPEEEEKGKDETKDNEEKKNKDEKKEPEEELVNTVIHVDETLVKKKLANDPFVKRILRMAQKKKEQYMRKRKQELATAEY